MNAFVLDTSTALKWFLEDEDDRAYGLAILDTISDDTRPVVPWLWYYEIGNGLLTQVRRKRISFDEVTSFLEIIDEMPIDVDLPNSSALLKLPHLAQAHKLTNYDAAYLELANRLQLPLATNDKDLMRAASECGTKLLPMPGMR
jgi:predicted nucleic acid-binding protein